MKKNVINTAVATVLAAASQGVSATTMEFDWTGNFTMLDPTGVAMSNTSAAKGANSFQTAVTGTMAFDDVTGAGTVTMVPFDFYASPAEAVGINIQAIGDGMGGGGSLVMGNMLFNWSGMNGIPVSIVMDAAGFFGSLGYASNTWADGVLDGADVAGYGAVPASDGTYINGTWGYLAVGAVPLATTEWNLTQAANCGSAKNFTTFAEGGGCMGNSTSGVLPLVADTAANANEYLQGDGFGIGGVPMWDGPFANKNANFDILSMTMVDSVGYNIAPNCDFDPWYLCRPAEVPVPAAVWLFGSGLLGFIGLTRRKKFEV